MKKTRRLSCKNKRQYASKALANDAMHSYLRRNVGGLKTNSEAYKCGDHWHWGHYRKAKR